MNRKDKRYCPPPKGLRRGDAGKGLWWSEMKVSNVTLEEMMAMSPAQKWEFICKEVRDDGETADVAILLGSNPQDAIERAEAAAALYRAGRVKYIVASGGVDWEYNGEQLSEADLMQRVLLAGGVPEEAILLDQLARTTKENMLCSTIVLERTLKIATIDSVVIVTSRSHMKRSLALAKALLPRKFRISGYPAEPKQTREEWLAEEKHQNALNTSVRLIKGLVDGRVIEDMDIDVLTK